MKYAKVFRVLGLAAILSLLFLAIPATPALAAEKIDLDPEEGEIGDSVDIDGTGFTQTELVGEEWVNKHVDIYFTHENGDIDDIDDLDNYEMWTDSVSTNDRFSKTISIPSVLRDGDEDEDVHGGTYYVYVTYEDEDDVEDYAEFTVIAGEITLDPTEGVVDTEVDITGEYFAGSEDITVEYDGVEEDIESGDNRSDSHGEFTCSILIPESTAGEHTITVTGDEGSEAEATFTVEPEITVDPTSGVPADVISVTGTGFGDETDIDIILETYVVGSGETNEYGSFDASFEVPDIDEGSYDIRVEDYDGNEVEAVFTVNIATEVNITPVTSQASPGYVGMDITISGVGFEPNYPITITYATAPVTVATTTSTPDGTFIATFEVPESEAGAHTITATDGTNSLQVLFYMESEAPPIPQPLLPAMDTKVKSLTEFSWEDVTDDSLPVTYTLQVATDEDFTAGSIVLNEEGLTDLEYTITGEDKLDPRKQEDPYYWRVQATDGASNESGWSAPGSFYMGGITLPNWGVHLWWGLGVVGAIFLGYWIGKRRAAYLY